MSNLNRRGVSNLVAAVVLILVGIVSVTIVFISLNSFAAKLSPQLSCTELEIKNSLRIESACYNSLSNEIEIIVDRGIQDDVSIVRLEFTGAGLDWLCGGSCSSDCNVLETGSSKKYYLSLEGRSLPEEIVLAVNGCSLVSSKIDIC